MLSFYLESRRDRPAAIRYAAFKGLCRTKVHVLRMSRARVGGVVVPTRDIMLIKRKQQASVQGAKKDYSGWVKRAAVPRDVCTRMRLFY